MLRPRERVPQPERVLGRPVDRLVHEPAVDGDGRRAVLAGGGEGAHDALGVCDLLARHLRVRTLDRGDLARSDGDAPLAAELAPFHWSSVNYWPLDDGLRQSTVREHAAIMGALADRDAEQASELMHEHIVRVHHEIKRRAALKWAAGAASRNGGLPMAAAESGE